jgi:hypothetical protein
MNKALMALLVASAALVHTNFAFSQTSQAPVTRASVKAELAELQKAGYRPGLDHSAYPRYIQAAEARIAAQNDMASYGTPADGTSASGSRQDPVQVGGVRSIDGRP